MFSRPEIALHRARARAYTTVEVMMALVMMGVGAAAVMTMQKASVQGNLDARKMDVANSIARLWIERLQRDAMTWTLPSPTSPAQNNFGNTLLLNGNVDTGWYVPAVIAPANLEIISPGFDILGRDLDQSSLASAVFCVNVRLSALVNNVSSPQNNLIRSDVRVLWARGIAAVPNGGLCDATVGASPNPNPLIYHAIYATTVLRENAQP